MAITSASLVRTGPVAARLEYASDQVSPTFRVYRDGVLIATTAATWLDVAFGRGEYPVFEVYDDATAPGLCYPDRATVQWRGQGAGIAHYRVEQFVGAAWAVKARVPETGAGYYHWRSARLADATEHSFRVIAVGVGGAESVAASLDVLLVRVPDPPGVDFSYDPETGAVTLSAA